MDTVLLMVTLTSLVLGLGMSVVAWQLLRHQRERSAARVEALRVLSNEAPEAAPTPAPALPPIEPALPRFVEPTKRTSLTTARREDAPVIAGPPADAAIDAPLHHERATAAADDLPWDRMRRTGPSSARDRVAPAEVAVRFAATDEPRASAAKAAAAGFGEGEP